MGREGKKGWKEKGNEKRMKDKPADYAPNLKSWIRLC